MPSLQCVQKVGALVAQFVNLILSLALDQVVALARQLLLVLALESDVHDETAEEDTRELVGNDGAVTLEVAWCVKEDVAAHHTVQVTPANHHTEHDTTLVDTLNVVGHPSNGDGDDGVDSESTEEATKILHSRVVRCHDHDETSHSNGSASHDEETSLLGSIREETDRDGDGGGQSVGGDTEQLVLDDLILGGEGEVLDDGRKEDAEGVEGHQGTHVDEHTDVGLPVAESLPEIRVLVLLVLGGRLLISLKSEDDALAILGGEELGLVGEVVNHPERSDTSDNGEETLENEDPSPTLDTTKTVHLLNTSSEETTERASKGGGGEEQSSTGTELASLVPARKVVVDTGEETSLSQSEEPSSSHETGPVLDETHTEHAETPKNPIEAC